MGQHIKGFVSYLIMSQILKSILTRIVTKLSEHALNVLDRTCCIRSSIMSLVGAFKQIIFYIYELEYENVDFYLG